MRGIWVTRTDWIIAGIVWALVLSSIWRGYRKERRIDQYALLTWGIFISMGVLMTFRSQTLQVYLSDKFYGQPVGAWISGSATVTAAWLYGMSLQRFPPVETLPKLSYHRWLIWSAPLCLILVSLTLLVGIATQPEPWAVFNVMRWLVSVEVTLLTVGMFVPVNLWMVQNETVFPMRVKHLALLAALIIYVSGTVVVVELMTFLLPFNLYDRVNGTVWILLGASCFAVLLVPHRWIMALLLPAKWWRYRRIVALEQAVINQTPIPVERSQFEWRRMLWSQYVEYAIYLKIINVLDCQRLISIDNPVGQRLQHQIDAVWRQNPDYDDLVKAISEVAL